MIVNVERLHGSIPSVNGIQGKPNGKSVSVAVELGYFDEIV